MSFKNLGIILAFVVAFTGLSPTGDRASAVSPGEDASGLGYHKGQAQIEPALQADLSMEAVLHDTVIPERDLFDLAIRLKRVPAGAPRVIGGDVIQRTVGDQQTFWISDQTASSYFQVTATLRYATPHVYMWVENGYNVSDADIRRSAERFENQVYPLTRQIFGGEWQSGVDGDPHINIFNGYVPGVGGYYSSADEFPRQVNPYSNQRKMIYINLDNATPGSDYYDGILAHELQHMIHWHHDRNEATWVNEGMSDLSAQLNGFGTSGAVSAFVNQPDTQLTSWPDSPSEASANYGAAHSFMNYLLQRFGDRFIQSLVAEKEDGLSGIDKVLQDQQPGVTAIDVFADWVIANYLGNPEAASDGRFGPRLVQTPPKIDAVHDAYPVERATEVRQFGTDYIELRGSGDVQILFEAPAEVKIVNNDAHSGQYQWWSNRGDDSNMTLTRSFDLRGQRSATLEFWMWYDIEKDWDYAYVEISTDGGQSWDILRGTHSSDYNPNGNSFGWAYTGISGGGETPIWTHERIDLTPYVGQEVMIRFEYVTDDAVNHVGLCLDDISIPELGYLDDVESAADWEARGFVRSNNRLLQRFLLQLIEFGPEVRVRRLGAATGQERTSDASAHEPPAAEGITPAPLELACQPYEVQAGDNLWNLAERFLGNGGAAGILVAATNAQHQIDPAYAQIENSRLIRVGQRLCVPADDETRKAVLALSNQTESASGSPAQRAMPSEHNLVTGSYQFILRGLGKETERAVLVVSGVAPVTTEIAPYRYMITPLLDNVEESG